ncbi:peptidase, partial [Pseudoalteromonas issachenkonii]
IIEDVGKVTHIAPSDEYNHLIGVPQEQFGVIYYAARDLGLCMGFTDSPYVTTTEVYPDSPTATDVECILAQVA